MVNHAPTAKTIDIISTIDKGFIIIPFPKVSATLSPNSKIPAMFKAQAKTIANFNFKYPDPTAGAKVSSFEPIPKLIVDAPQILKMSNRNIGRVTISTHISGNCSYYLNQTIFQDGYKKWH